MTSDQLAQLVEQRTENPCVFGSIPKLGMRNERIPESHADLGIFMFENKNYHSEQNCLAQLAISGAGW